MICYAMLWDAMRYEQNRNRTQKSFNISKRNGKKTTFITHLQCLLKVIKIILYATVYDMV